MIENSKDVLNLTLSFCAIWVSVFICWLIYYMIATIKKTHDVINFFSKTVNSINDFISEVKDKAHGSMAYFKLFGMLTEKFISYVDKKGILRQKTKEKSEKKPRR